MFARKRIAIVGTHNTGKSTLCHSVAAKLMTRGIKVGVAWEPSRSNLHLAAGIRGYETQMSIFASVVGGEMEAERTNDIVICDRSILDVIAYTQALTDHPNETQTKYTQAMSKFAIDYANTYLSIFKTCWRFDMKRSADPLRIPGCDFQDKIDCHIESLLTLLEEPAIRLNEPETAANDIEQWIVNKISPQGLAAR